MSTFTAFVDFFCLCRSAAWPAPLPLSTFTAFLGFYCLCRLLLPLSTVADFVDFYCLCRLLLPLSTFTAFVGFHCLCLISLSLSAMLTLTTGCRNLLIVSSILLCKLTFGFLQTLSLYRDRSHLVYFCCGAGVHIWTAEFNVRAVPDLCPGNQPTAQHARYCLI